MSDVRLPASENLCCCFSVSVYFHIQAAKQSFNSQRSNQKLVALFRRDDDVTFSFSSSHNWFNKLLKVKRLLVHDFFHENAPTGGCLLRSFRSAQKSVRVQQKGRFVSASVSTEFNFIYKALYLSGHKSLYVIIWAKSQRIKVGFLSFHTDAFCLPRIRKRSNPF